VSWKKEWKWIVLAAAVFALCFWLPVEWLQSSKRLANAFWEAMHLVRDYAREHVLLCLVPAFLIAGGIAVFVGQASVLRYLGAKANKVLAYGVASVSGTVLAVCSCTVLPLFAGIYRMGAGLGPATTFLYAGPAINVLAVILTARVLGLQLGIARAVGAVFFSVVIGLVMHFLFRKEEEERAAAQAHLPEPEVSRPLWQNAVYFASMVGFLVFANWAAPEKAAGVGHAVHAAKWVLAGLCVAVLAVSLWLWFSRKEMAEWLDSSWTLAKQILPLLLAGVLVAGALLGRPGHEALIPSEWVAWAVGGNGLRATLLASLLGALMYFATLTEVPILQGLIGSGMGEGPALALLLAGPAVSLPNLLVIRQIIGTKKTAVFLVLVVAMATVTGMLYGAVAG
jgi:uncharacterized membrane protein YraQ (UPF0718 family)